MLLSKQFTSLILMRNFLFFLSFELICMIFLLIYYYCIIYDLRNDSYSSLENSSKELLIGYTEAMNTRLNSMKEASIIPAKEIEIFSKMDSNIYYQNLLTKSCLISQEELNEDTFFNSLKNKKDISKSIYDYIKNDLNKTTEEEFIEEILNNDYLNKVSYLLHNGTHNSTYDSLVCSLVSVMKSI
ncbi:MAG: hypothetical protein MJ252_12710, partial [archaeon]|nr:hypothetical protein [archaeon]